MYRRKKKEQKKKKGKWTDIEWITRKVLDYFTTYYAKEGEKTIWSETISAEESMKGVAEKCDEKMNRMSIMLGDDLSRENTDEVDKTETISVVRMTGKYVKTQGNVTT